MFFLLKMSQNQIYDFVVIGAGPSGLVCAALLSKLKKRVCLVEAHDRLGGGMHHFDLFKFRFYSGMHYLGKPDEVTKNVLKACNSFSEPGEPWKPTEKYIFEETGTQSSLFPGEFHWSLTTGLKSKDINTLSKVLVCVIAAKILPYYVAWVLFYAVKLLMPVAFKPYSQFCKQKGALPEATMQQGDVGGDPSAMVGAAVAKYYMNGTSTISENFVKNCRKMIKKSGGCVLLNAKATEILDDAVVTTRQTIRGKKIISSIGASGTARLAGLKDLQRVTDKLKPNVRHQFCFLGLKGSLEDHGIDSNIVWIKKKDYVLFVSAHKNPKDPKQTCISLIAESGAAPFQDMISTFLFNFGIDDKCIVLQDTATHHSVKKYLGRYSSYGLSCGPERFDNFETVRALAPATSKKNLFLTGQDILLPGVTTQFDSALLTLRAVLGVTIWDFLTGNDVLNQISESMD